MTPDRRRASPRARRATATLTALVALTLTGCVTNGAPGSGSTDGPTIIEITSTATGCEPSVRTVPSGPVVFTVANSGTDVTEFYVLAADGLRVMSELENIGPGLSRDLVVSLAPADYVLACKPGMVGEGIRTGLAVTDSGADVGPIGDTQEQLADAAAQYAGYVREQSDTLIAATEDFAAHYVAGDDDEARASYAPARVHWERIEPVAESFGDLDPRLDLREADLAEGETWTGWHRIEKDLWPPADGYSPLTDAERAQLAATLVGDTQDLVDRVAAADFSFSADQIGNGAKELLDEVATGKVTGEEEIWSHTDLWDFRANVDGALVAFEVLRPVAEQKDPELVASLATRFDELTALLARHGSIEGGFIGYDELSADQVRELAAAVDAVSEPLSRLTATVVL